MERIAHINGLEVDIERVIKRKRLRKLIAESLLPGTQKKREEKNKWLRLPYLGAPTERLASELHRFGYKVGFYPLSTLGQLSQLKDPTEKMKKSGIYRISCGECDSFYIGQTGRKLQKRLQEHRTAFNSLKNKDSAFAAHCLQTGHNYNKSSASLLHTESKGRLLNRLEEVEIINAATSSPNNLLNDLDSTFVNPFISFFFDYSPGNRPV